MLRHHLVRLTLRAAFVAAMLAAAACTTTKSSNVPVTPPEGYAASCAGALHSWDDIRDNPEDIGAFLCIDAPKTGDAIASGAAMSLWASYPYTSDVVLQIDTADPAGHHATASYPRHYDDPGEDHSFWMIHLDGAEVPIPADTPPGESLRVVVVLASKDDLGRGLVNAEVTVSVAK